MDDILPLGLTPICLIARDVVKFVYKIYHCTSLVSIVEQRS